jgi:hypothetical protein
MGAHGDLKFDIAAAHVVTMIGRNGYLMLARRPGAERGFRRESTKPGHFPPMLCIFWYLLRIYDILST